MVNRNRYHSNFPVCIRKMYIKRVLNSLCLCLLRKKKNTVLWDTGRSSEAWRVTGAVQGLNGITRYSKEAKR